MNLIDYRKLIHGLFQSADNWKKQLKFKKSFIESNWKIYKSSFDNNLPPFDP